MLLGGGREKKEDSVDPSVGLVLEKKIGDAVRLGKISAPCTTTWIRGCLMRMRLLSESFEIGDASAACRAAGAQDYWCGRNGLRLSRG